MKKYFYIGLSALSLLVLSCTEKIQETGRIAFTVSEAAVAADVATKAEVDINTLGSFNVGCSTGEPGEVESPVWMSVFTGSGGTYTSDKYWPVSDPDYHFTASNAALVHSSTGYNVSASASTDVVVAYTPYPVFKYSNRLSFYHVFARLGDVTVNARDGYTLEGVSIMLTPLVSGTYNVPDGNGKTDRTGWSNTVEGTPVSVSTASAGTRSNDLYLVPGTYELTASWKAVKGVSVQEYRDKKRTVSLKAGVINRLTTTLGGNAEEVEFTVSVAPWSDNDINTEF